MGTAYCLLFACAAYASRMRYRAEVYLRTPDGSATLLGTWAQWDAAFDVCATHAERPLEFVQKWRGLWQACTETVLYQIILVSS